MSDSRDKQFHRYMQTVPIATFNDIVEKIARKNFPRVWEACGSELIEEFHNDAIDNIRADWENEHPEDEDDADQWSTDNPHPKYGIEDWRYEVRNGDTKLGYTEWVEHNIESHRTPKPSWETVADNDVQMHWKCGACGALAIVNPDFYEGNGTPVCGDCDEDMSYVATEIRIKRKRA